MNKKVFFLSIRVLVQVMTTKKKRKQPKNPQHYLLISTLATGQNKGHE